LNQCIIDETDGYLIGLETPDNETVYR